MSTFKQIKVAKILSENPRKPIGKAMIEAGYSESTSKRPADLTRSKGWQEFMDAHFSNDKIAEVEKAQLKAVKMNRYAFPKSQDDKKIKEIIEAFPNCRLVTITISGGWKQAYFFAPDNVAIGKSLNRIYKLKGSYQAEKIKTRNPFDIITNDELDERRRLVGEELVRRYKNAKVHKFRKLTSKESN